MPRGRVRLITFVCKRTKPLRRPCCFAVCEWAVVHAMAFGVLLSRDQEVEDSLRCTDLWIAAADRPTEWAAKALLYTSLSSSARPGFTSRRTMARGGRAESRDPSDGHQSRSQDRPRCYETRGWAVSSGHRMTPAEKGQGKGGEEEGLRSCECRVRTGCFSTKTTCPRVAATMQECSYICASRASTSPRPMRRLRRLGRRLGK